MITDKEMTMVMQYYDDIGIRKKEIRSYEVSLWTLQDEFITVLKWSDVEQKGRIEEPIMTLNIDGTEEFTCKIPMYIRYKGELIENPNWYAKDEFMIVNLRKMKVILNKRTADEAVFEFLIVEVTEEHEKDILTCNIKCQGLAFHELGKIGYKVALSQETFNEIHDKWLDAEYQEGEEPIMNVDFWCGKDGLRLPKAEGQEQDPTIWYYKVEMNWYSFKEGTGRDPHKVYEEPYATNWNEVLQPLNVEEYKEKARPISVENSNIYNITQTIAEAFQIYCRYEYGHDENYHINSRTIVFYNNFMQEGNVFSLTYPHSSSRVSRTMDCNDLTTKLYVLKVDNDVNLSGYNSITNAGANATHEDYILDFEYLYKTRGITQEQYDAIHQFQIDIKKLNEEIFPAEDMLNKYNNEKPTIDGKKEFYKNSIDLDIENINSNQELFNELDAKDGTDGVIEVSDQHPELGVIITTREQPYINLNYSKKGIKTDTMEIYRNYDTSNGRLSNQIHDFYFEYDEYGQPTRILGVEPIKDNEGNVTNARVYMIYKYTPKLYYDSVIKTWQDKLAADETNAEKYTQLAETIDRKIEEYQKKLYLKEEEVEQLQAQIAAEHQEYTPQELEVAQAEIKLGLTEQKKLLIKRFEQMLGPALREGYWQPEDYQDYDNNLNIASNVTYTYNEDYNMTDTGMGYVFGWDADLLEDEQDIYYEQGANLEKHYYPCINLSNVPISLNNINEYSFVFNNNYVETNLEKIEEHPVQYTQSFRIGSQAKLMYIKNGTTIIPVLVLIGAKTMTDAQINFACKPDGAGHPRLSIISTEMDEDTESIVMLDESEHWITLSDNYFAVYPRAKFTSLDLRLESIKSRYNDVLLENYRDYSTLNRINEISGKLEIVVTIKPEVMMKLNTENNKISIAYALSNANTQIYLDAMAISRENAVPKVSYEVTPSILDRSIIRTLYSKLAQLVMVNDSQLKFRDTFGYISSVTLNLDKVTDDSIEVKNYKTKFEDLFSNIVAQTESMKRAENLMAASITGSVPLSLEGIQSSFNNNIDYVTQFLDNYFNTSRCVDKKLGSLFSEAGQILGGANQVLNQMNSITMDNANILSSFVQDVQAELTTKVTRSPNRPVEFKVGDVWIQTENNESNSRVIARYVATMNSSELTYEKNEHETDTQLQSTAGFARTYNGALASISGASLKIDNVTGEVELLAKNHMQLGTAGDLDIIGGRTVTIAGPTINIISESSEVTNPSVGSINLIATNYSLVDEDLVSNLNSAVSKVCITPTKISMAAAEMELKAASTIKMFVSQGELKNTSAIWLDADKGLWLGSGAGVHLFSGRYQTSARTHVGPMLPTVFSAGDFWIQVKTEDAGHKDNDGTDSSNQYYTNLILNDELVSEIKIYNAKCNSTDKQSTKTIADWEPHTLDTVDSFDTAKKLIRVNGPEGSSVEMNPDHLVFGYMNTRSGSGNAIEINEDHVIIGSGSLVTSDINNDKNITGQSGGLVGAKFTSSSIGFATITNGLVMNGGGITLGAWDADTTSAVNLSTATAADIKSVTGAYVNIAGSGITISSGGNLYVNTPNFKVDTGNTIFATGTFGNTSIADVTGLTASDTWTGVINNSHGFFVRGGITATSLTATSNYGKFIANGNSFGLYKADGTTGILTATVDSNGNSFLTSSGKLTISAGQHFYLNAGGVIIDTAAASGNIFSVSKTGGGSLTLDTSGNLSVTGAINATSGNFSGSITSSATISGGTISGGNISGSYISSGVLDGATGSFTGSVTALSGTIGEWNIGNALVHTSNKAYIGTDYIGFGNASGGSSGTTSYAASNGNSVSISNGASYSISAVVGLSSTGDLYINNIYFGNTSQSHSSNGNSISNSATNTSIFNATSISDIWSAIRAINATASTPTSHSHAGETIECSQLHASGHIKVGSGHSFYIGETSLSESQLQALKNLLSNSGGNGGNGNSPSPYT